MVQQANLVDVASERLTAAVRQALRLMVFDPPFDLGRSALAQLVLPHETNIRQRGETLRLALHKAVQSLYPPATTPPYHAHWLLYAICCGEYLQGHSRMELLDQLAISASTYSRAKKRALLHIADMLPDVLAAAGGRSAEEGP